MTSVTSQFDDLFDILAEQAGGVFAEHGSEGRGAVEHDPERSLVVVSIGFGGRDLRGAITLAARGDVFESLAPAAIDRPLDTALLVDFAGELCNLVMGRFRNALLRRNIEVACGTPTAVRGTMTELVCLLAQRSEWRSLATATGEIRVRLDASFREGFVLTSDVMGLEPVVTDMFF